MITTQQRFDATPPSLSLSASPPPPPEDLERAIRIAGLASVVSAGAIFGFFYAWVCSTMWGLDEADPRVAIAAMQAMNASVRNAVFFPAFFLTPFVLGGTALLARVGGHGRAARRFGLAAVVYLLGGLVLTGTVNVPMNRELAEVVVPTSMEDARTIWDDYSGTWQVWNLARTIFSGLSLLLVGSGLLALGRRPSSR